MVGCLISIQVTMLEAHEECDLLLDMFLLYNARFSKLCLLDLVTSAGS